MTEVEASSVGHDLSRGVAHFSRTRRAPGETAAESAEAPAASSQDGEEPAGRDGPGLPDGRGKEETAGTGGAGRSGAGEDGVGKKSARKSGAGKNGAGENGAGENGAGGDGVLDDRAVAEFASEIG